MIPSSIKRSDSVEDQLHKICCAYNMRTYLESSLSVSQILVVIGDRHSRDKATSINWGNHELWKAFIAYGDEVDPIKIRPCFET